MMASIHAIRPVAHLPLILGMLRKLKVASLIDELIPPHPGNVISCGTGVEALVLAILDGDHVLYKVGSNLDARGMLPLLQEHLERESLNDYRLGHVLDALFAANLNRVFGALSLQALSVYGIEVAWLHDRGREELPLPALRTVRAVLPHTALQSVVSSSGLARLHTGFMKGEKPMRREERIWPALMILVASTIARAFLTLA